jgi:hypothetical protein
VTDFGFARRRTPHTCPCGSDEPCWAEHDGYGIFLTFVCDKCRQEKLSRFRPDIMERYDTDEQIEEDL